MFFFFLFWFIHIFKSINRNLTNKMSKLIRKMRGIQI
jgi:hypothetical protein